MKGSLEMATIAQIERMLAELERIHPVAFFRRMDETQAGIGAVLRLLHTSEEEITAGKISEVLNISTARVAVLIRKMAAKGLITKARSSVDARVTMVGLTELGVRTVEGMRREMYQQMGLVIDAVGEERLREFLKIAAEIRAAVNPPQFCI